jgi:hypothetical protein
MLSYNWVRLLTTVAISNFEGRLPWDICHIKKKTCPKTTQFTPIYGYGANIWNAPCLLTVNTVQCAVLNCPSVSIPQLNPWPSECLPAKITSKAPIRDSKRLDPLTPKMVVNLIEYYIYYKSSHLGSSEHGKWGCSQISWSIIALS